MYKIAAAPFLHAYGILERIPTLFEGKEWDGMPSRTDTNFC